MRCIQPPDQSRRDLTQSCTAARIRVSASPGRGGAFAIRRIALHRTGLPWVKRTKRKVQGVSGELASRERPARDGRAGLRAKQESVAMKFLPRSGSAKDGGPWTCKRSRKAKRRKASPGVLSETGRSSIELNLDSVALWRWPRKGRTPGKE